MSTKPTTNNGHTSVWNPRRIEAAKAAWPNNYTVPSLVEAENADMVKQAARSYLDAIIASTARCKTFGPSATDLAEPLNAQLGENDDDMRLVSAQDCADNEKAALLLGKVIRQVYEQLQGKAAGEPLDTIRLALTFDAEFGKAYREYAK